MAAKATILQVQILPEKSLLREVLKAVKHLRLRRRGIIPPQAKLI